MTTNQIPNELMTGRKILECNFIFALYKDPEELPVYKDIRNGKDIITSDGIFYFGLLRDMYDAGLRTLDSISILGHVSKNPDVKKAYDTRGGFKTIAEISSLISPSNLPSYHEELVKSNLMIHLHNAGFGVLDELPKLRRMTSDEIYDYYNYKLNDIVLTKVGKLQAENLSEGYEDAINEWDKGTAVGYKIGFPRLNWRFAGVHKKNLLLHEGHIGNGKTTTALLFYVLPVIESGENICILANEQGIDEFRQMILASVLFNKVDRKYHGTMNRHKFITGGFSPQDREGLQMAADWLKEQPGKISFVSLENYALEMVEKVIRKYARLGCGIFLFDTMKPESDANDWGIFSDVAKKLFEIAKNEDVAIIATAQLSSESMGRRFLDLSSTGKAKAIAETATQVAMFRNIMEDERQRIFPYERVKDENGKWVKNVLTWNPDRDYIVLFTPKNRFGETGPQIVYEINRSFNYLKEIGYIDIPYDQPYRR